MAYLPLEVKVVQNRNSQTIEGSGSHSTRGIVALVIGPAGFSDPEMHLQTKAFLIMKIIKGQGRCKSLTGLCILVI